MKQIGNLAAVCAKRPDILMQVYEGMVAVYVGAGPHRAHMLSAWDDDAKIENIIHELNFGIYAPAAAEVPKQQVA